MKVLHIIPDLQVGGAEIFLRTLLPDLQKAGIQSKVVSLRNHGIVGGQLESLGIPVVSLGVRGYFSALHALPRLRHLVRQYQPDVLHGWLYHGNLAAYFSRGALPAARLFWSIRHSIRDLKHEKAVTRLVIRLGARFSHRVDRIIYNAGASAMQHSQAGFASARAAVIANGIDTGRFSPNPEMRAASRRRYGFQDQHLLVGIIGRHHPIKGHDIFVRAAKTVAHANQQARFVMVGRGLDETNSELGALLRALDLTDRVHLLGEHGDIPEILNTLDIYVSASWGEGFPNVVGEAMACGVPCAVTDVGASRELVADTGTIVPPGSTQQLAAAILDLAALPPERRHALGAEARKRIVARYSRERCVLAYTNLYQNLDESVTQAVS